MTRCPPPAGELAERAAEVALADPGLAGDDHVELLEHPGPARQLVQRRPRQPPGRARFDVLDAGVGEAQLGVLEQPGEPAVIAGEVLGVDQQREALVEGELAHPRVLVLLLPREGHRPQPHGEQLLHRRFVQHLSPFPAQCR